jgi:hypothetical protein
VRFDDETKFQEVKTRAANKSELGRAFMPSKKANIPCDEIELEAELIFDINTFGPDSSVLCQLKILGKLSTCKVLHGMHWSSTFTCWKDG